MSKANYELWYLDDAGNRLAYINDAASFEYVAVLGDIGVGMIVIPRRGQIYDNELIDRRVAFYRQPDGGPLALDFVMMNRTFETITSREGQYQRIIHGVDFNELLARRIVAYYAGSAQATMTAEADDMMKEIVRDNFVDNADYSGTPSPARDIDSYGFSVQADTTSGTSITKSFAWRNVLTTLQDIQADSKAQSDEVFFTVVPTSETAMEFRTWTTPNDRTTTSGVNPIVFSLEWGNLVNPRLVDDADNTSNYVYGAGQGQEASRVIQTASDTTRINQSRLNRREALAYSNGVTTAAVLTDARNELERKRPSTKLYADISSTPLTPYGGLNGWKLGDKTTVSFAGRQFDVIVRAVHVKVDGRGEETIRGRVESV